LLFDLLRNKIHTRGGQAARVCFVRLLLQLTAALDWMTIEGHRRAIGWYKC